MPVIGKVVAPETVVIVVREPDSARMAIAENRKFNYKQLEKNGLVKKLTKSLWKLINCRRKGEL